MRCHGCKRHNALIGLNTAVRLLGHSVRRVQNMRNAMRKLSNF